MKHLTILLLLSLLFAGCSSDSEQSLKEKELELKERELELKEKELDLANKDSKSEKVGYDFTPNASITKSSSNVAYKGNILKEVTWKDENGENLALFTGNSNSIWVYHYIFSEGKAKLLRKFKDFVKDCPFDINLEINKNSIDITDLNNDNYGELSFAYTMGCRSDVSALDMKLILTENGDKYIIRGRQTLVFHNDTYPGDKKIGPSLKNGPTEFLNYAKRRWNLFEREEF